MQWNVYCCINENDLLLELFKYNDFKCEDLWVCMIVIEITMTFLDGWAIENESNWNISSFKLFFILWESSLNDVRCIDHCYADFETTCVYYIAFFFGQLNSLDGSYSMWCVLSWSKVSNRGIKNQLKQRDKLFNVHNLKLYYICVETGRPNPMKYVFLRNW